MAEGEREIELRHARKSLLVRATRLPALLQCVRTISAMPIACECSCAMRLCERDARAMGMAELQHATRCSGRAAFIGGRTADGTYLERWRCAGDAVWGENLGWNARMAKDQCFRKSLY